MEKYNVIFTKSSVKELGDIPQKDAQKILKRASELAANPRPMGCEKLVARPLIESVRATTGLYISSTI